MGRGERSEEAAEAQFEFRHEHHLSLPAISVLLCWLDGGIFFPLWGRRKGKKNTYIQGIYFVLRKLSVLSMCVNELFCINLQVSSCI